MAFTRRRKPRLSAKVSKALSVRYLWPDGALMALDPLEPRVLLDGTHLAFVGTISDGILGSPLGVTGGGSGSATTITVNIDDGNGSPIQSDSSTITLSILAGPNGATFVTGGQGGQGGQGNGSSNGTQSVTTLTAQIHNGAASFSNVVLSAAGSFTLEAIDTNLTVTAATSNQFTVTSPQLAFIVQPISNPTGQPLFPSVQVAVEDSNGEVLTSNTSTVALNILGSSATLSGTTSVAAVKGIATFTGISISATGTFKLIASDGAFATVTSNPFNVGPTPATMLGFGRVPGTFTAGHDGTVSVLVEGLNGNVTSFDHSQVTLTIASGPSNGKFSLGGTNSTTTLTAAVVNGVANFTSVAFTTSGTYSLAASDGTYTAASSHTFTVVADAASSRLGVTQLPGPAVVNGRLSPVLTVEVIDQFNNIVTTDRSTVTLTMAAGDNATNAMLSGTTVLRAIRGVATFRDITINATGSFHVLVTDASLAGTSGAGSFTQVIQPGPTRVVSSPHSRTVQAGSTIRLSAKFASGVPLLPLSGTALLAGTVKDQAGNTLVSNATIGSLTITSSGIANFVESFSAGTYVLTVSYEGDSIHGAATSQSFTLTVPASDSSMITLAPPNGTIVSGQSFNMVATVSPIKGSGTPSGTVTLMEGTTIITSGTLNSSGVVTLNVPAETETAGKHTFTVVYGGDADFRSSRSKQGLTVTVGKDTPVLNLVILPSQNVTTGQLTAVAGVATTVTATLTVDGESTSTATGLVTIFDGSTLESFGTLTLNGSASTATFSITFQDAGTLSLTAEYAGDANNNSAQQAVTMAVTASSSGATHMVLLGSL